MKILLLIIFIISPLISFSQNKELTPLEITEKLFSNNGFPEKNLYLCCEMKQDIESDSTMGQTMPDSISRKFELLSQDSLNAVVAVSLQTSKIKNDWYLFFKKDLNWKLEAMRALALTGIAGKIVEAYENVSEDSLRRVDSLMSAKMDSLRLIKTDSLITKEKFSIMKLVRQARLELSSDKELMEYFLKHKMSFVNLVNIFTEKFESLEEGAEKFNKDSMIIKSLDSLAIHSFSFGNDFSEGKAGYCFLIGGILDNMVGFFYEPDKRKIPKMSKSGFIMIREIGDGWYLYKTT